MYWMIHKASPTSRYTVISFHVPWRRKWGFTWWTIAEVLKLDPLCLGMMCKPGGIKSFQHLRLALQLVDISYFPVMFRGTWVVSIHLEKKHCEQQGVKSHVLFFLHAFVLSRSQTGIRRGKLTSNPLLTGNSTVEFGVVQYLSQGCEQGLRGLWIGASCLPSSSPCPSGV